MRAFAYLVLAAVVAAQSSVPPPPTESVGCVLHGDHYHCDGPAVTATPSKTVSGVPPPPTESTGCELHGDHYHCTGKADGSASGHEDEHNGHEDEHDEHAAAEAQAAETGECIIHVGHSHGNCSEKDLACGAVLMEDYNLPLHIGAVFIILVTSALGVMLPIVAGWKEAAVSHGWRGWIFFVARHFGTGILLATAFIHLMFHGFVMFNNKCLGELAFAPASPAIALAAAFATFLLDFVGSRAAHRSSHRHEEDASSSASTDEEKPAGVPRAHAHAHGHAQQSPFADACLHAEALQREQGWQVILLEAGIIFHSIMIGVTLGTGSGSGWVTLLIVIVFHQFFEGAALGARIALLSWISKTRAAIMGIAFMIITPIGIAIGIGVRKSFAQNGRAALLSVGILNSISAGILLYTAFRLLGTDFTDGGLRSASMGRVTVAMSAMLVGMVAMSVLGVWA